MSEPSKPTGPDLAAGVPLDDLPDGGMLSGHVGEEPVLLARRGDEIFAIGATCSHYGGPLAEGLLVGDSVRCPWHHARFSLRTGAAIGAPAFNPLPCWRVEKRDGKVFVHEKAEPADRRRAGDGSKLNRTHPNAWSSWAAGRRASRRPRCCGAKDLPAASRFCPPTTRLPTTGRIARRTISPATHPKTGCRSSRANSTPSMRSTSSCVPT